MCLKDIISHASLHFFFLPPTDSFRRMSAFRWDVLVCICTERRPGTAGDRRAKSQRVDFQSTQLFGNSVFSIPRRRHRSSMWLRAAACNQAAVNVTRKFTDRQRGVEERKPQSLFWEAHLTFLLFHRKKEKKTSCFLNFFSPSRFTSGSPIPQGATPVNPITCFVCSHRLSRHREHCVGQVDASSLGHIMQFKKRISARLRTCCLQGRKKNKKTSSYLYFYPLYAHVKPFSKPPFFRKFSPRSITQHFSWPGLMSVSFTTRYFHRGKTDETGLGIYLSLLTSSEPPQRG